VHIKSENIKHTTGRTSPFLAQRPQMCMTCSAQPTRGRSAREAGRTPQNWYVNFTTELNVRGPSGPPGAVGQKRRGVEVPFAQQKTTPPTWERATVRSGPGWHAREAPRAPVPRAPGWGRRPLPVIGGVGNIYWRRTSFGGEYKSSGLG